MITVGGLVEVNSGGQVVFCFFSAAEAFQPLQLRCTRSRSLDLDNSTGPGSPLWSPQRATADHRPRWRPLSASVSPEVYAEAAPGTALDTLPSAIGHLDLQQQLRSQSYAQRWRSEAGGAVEQSSPEAAEQQDTARHQCWQSADTTKSNQAALQGAADSSQQGSQVSDEQPETTAECSVSGFLEVDRESIGGPVSHLELFPSLQLSTQSLPGTPRLGSQPSEPAEHTAQKRQSDIQILRLQPPDAESGVAASEHSSFEADSSPSLTGGDADVTGGGGDDISTRRLLSHDAKMQKQCQQEDTVRRLLVLSPVEGTPPENTAGDDADISPFPDEEMFEGGNLSTQSSPCIGSPRFGSPCPELPEERVLIVKAHQARLATQSEQFANELTHHLGICAPACRILRKMVCPLHRTRNIAMQLWAGDNDSSDPNCFTNTHSCK